MKYDTDDTGQFCNNEKCFSEKFRKKILLSTLSAHGNGLGQGMILIVNKKGSRGNLAQFVEKKIRQSFINPLYGINQTH